MNNIEYNCIKSHHELTGEVMVRKRSKGSSDFISQDGLVYLISDLDFTKVEQSA